MNKPSMLYPNEVLVTPSGPPVAHQDLWLVNGAERPGLTVKTSQWHRLRLVMAGVSTWLYLGFGACEVPKKLGGGEFFGAVIFWGGGRGDIVGILGMVLW